MVSKRDICSYFSVVSENVKKDSRISVPGIIISASDDISQSEEKVSTKEKNTKM